MERAISSSRIAPGWWSYAQWLPDHGGGQRTDLPDRCGGGWSGRSLHRGSVNTRVVKVTPGGAQTTVGSGLDSPLGVAVDGAGDVFIADTYNNRVVEVPAGGGAQTTVASGLSRPCGVAVDGAGNVFIADYHNNRVVEVPAGGGAQTTVGSGLNHPYGVAVDGAGDVFIAEPATTGWWRFRPVAAPRPRWAAD